ncbi:hypothetical protein GGH94_001062 [Coemansia aciculifera]|uniref:HMG box domain-containing protein n=1 Tax=Coemansia aciculifera TaxID=417176 RepID=A0A9W8ILD1_9FUNG|nr:hypothetical protein GGH94_001062 [Coemansia aciculifera]KAJ2869066.1 hypothetical protein GGH93_006275 [Coemansia aciculifera]
MSCLFREKLNDQGYSVLASTHYLAQCTANHSPPALTIAHPSKVAKSSKSARAAAAKRPLSDFNYFCRDARKLIVESHRDYTKEQVNRELGRIWSMLDIKWRQHYRALYTQNKQRCTPGAAIQAKGGVEIDSALLPTGNNTGPSKMVKDAILHYVAMAESPVAGTALPKMCFGNTIQSILNGCTGSVSPTVEDVDDNDEPLALTLF